MFLCRSQKKFPFNKQKSFPSLKSNVSFTSTLKESFLSSWNLAKLKLNSAARLPLAEFLNLRPGKKNRKPFEQSGSFLLLIYMQAILLITYYTLNSGNKSVCLKVQPPNWRKYRFKAELSVIGESVFLEKKKSSMTNLYRKNLKKLYISKRTKQV